MSDTIPKLIKETWDILPQWEDYHLANTRVTPFLRSAAPEAFRGCVCGGMKRVGNQIQFVYMPNNDSTEIVASFFLNLNGRYTYKFNGQANWVHGKLCQE